MAAPAAGARPLTPCNATLAAACASCEVAAAGGGATSARLLQQLRAGSLDDRRGKRVQVRLTVTRASAGAYTRVKHEGANATLRQGNFRPWVRGPDRGPWHVSVPAPDVDKYAWPATLPYLRSCAVVANSGLLLASTCGARIDAHDAVIRINDAAVAGYEPFVGSKETIRVHNSATIARRAIRQIARTRLVESPTTARGPAPGRVTHVVAASTSDEARAFFALRREYASDGAVHLRMLDHSMLHYYQVHTLHLPQFPTPPPRTTTWRRCVRRASCHTRPLTVHEYLYAPTVYASDRTFQALARFPRRRLDYPSTGLWAVLFATAACRSTSLYGFSFSTEVPRLVAEGMAQNGSTDACAAAARR